MIIVKLPKLTMLNHQLERLLAKCCSPEGQEATNGHVDEGTAIPGSRGDLPCYVLGATGSIKPTSCVLAKDSTKNSQGKANYTLVQWVRVRHEVPELPYLLAICI